MQKLWSTSPKVLFPPHEYMVDRPLYPATVVSGEWVDLWGYSDMVVVHFAHGGEPSMKVRGHSLHAQHTDIIWQHACKGVHH